MRAVHVEGDEGPGDLQVRENPDPSVAAEEILVRNFAAGVNRADLLQRRGLYPPPPGAPDLLGLEFAGEVISWGESVHGFEVGDRVFGLVAGGGYAEKVTVHRDLALSIPDTLSYDAAAATPEAFLTAHESLYTQAGLEGGETVLIHAGASGVGTAAIQLARHRGARVAITAGTPEKVERCLELGADLGIPYREQDFAERVAEWTAGEGVDVVLDFVGADYWERNIASLKPGGRLLVIGLLGGSKVAVDLREILFKRLRVIGIAMRGLPLEEKIAITARFRDELLPALESGELRPVLDRVFLLEEAAAAHERMEKNLNIGKIVLRF